MSEMITIEVTIKADIKTVWSCWTEPEHITKWNFASDDWHTTKAVNDLRVGGEFSSHMEAKDGSVGFDFSGKHLEVALYEIIKSRLDDDRTMQVLFEYHNDHTKVIESFDAEEENTVELQRNGWQSILDHFKDYVLSIQNNANIQKILPYLWFDKEAMEAAKKYVNMLEYAQIIDKSTLSDTPSGDVEIVEFQLANLKLNAMSAGPYFSFNPAISLMVSCETVEEVDKLYAELVKDGSELMPLDSYPFSKRYAWIQDHYGLNWQLMLTDTIDVKNKIRPCLLFSSDVCGKAETAMHFYQTVFKNTEIGFINRYTPGEAEDERAKINYAEMNIEGLQFVMMDHGSGGIDFFNEAFSFMISCDDQEEIDYYWNQLSFVPEAEQCGWVKDQFGVSWQIVPSAMSDFFTGTEEEVARVTEAMLKMKKIDINRLKNAKHASN